MPHDRAPGVLFSHGFTEFVHDCPLPAMQRGGRWRLLLQLRRRAWLVGLPSLFEASATGWTFLPSLRYCRRLHWRGRANPCPVCHRLARSGDRRTTFGNLFDWPTTRPFRNCCRRPCRIGTRNDHPRVGWRAWAAGARYFFNVTRRSRRKTIRPYHALRAGRKAGQRALLCPNGDSRLRNDRTAGDANFAKAEADTILAQAPSHLLGLILAVKAAGLRQDMAARTQFVKRFLAAVPAERKKKLKEYEDHKNDIDAELTAARGAKP